MNFARRSLLGLATAGVVAVVMMYPDSASAQGCNGSRWTPVRNVASVAGHSVRGWTAHVRARAAGIRGNCNGTAAVRSYGCSGSSVSSVLTQSVYVVETPKSAANWAPLAKPAPVIRTNCPGGVCPVPQTRWTWPGGTQESLRTHLQGDPHYHGAEVAALSFQQLEAIHSWEHETHAAATGDWSPYRPGSGKFFRGSWYALAEKSKPKLIAWM